MNTGNQVVTVRPTGAGAYSVHIGSGVAAGIAGMLPAGCTAAALVADDNVAALHAGELRAVLQDLVRTEIFRFPPGEKHKTRACKEQIEDQMIGEGFGRDCVVVALGGGVTTDLGGFVAATYLRSVPWIAMPTSLLAAVDASIGGKTGVNTPAGKNLVGAFHQPHAVLADLDLLVTLPPGEAPNGLAEMLKHAVVADAGHLDELVGAADGLRELDPDALIGPVRRSVEIKAQVVSRDPEETDLRQVLNFGHTIAHAIEVISRHEIRHGFAVAAGMSVEAQIACELGLLDTLERDRLRSALRRLSLPLAPPVDLEAADLLEATRVDKKGRRGRPRYSLPAAIGKMARGPEGYGRPVDDQVVLAALLEARRCSA